MELEQLGWNAVTIGAVGAILFTILEAWGLWQQKKTIWNNQSGKSISVVWFLYFANQFVVIFIYGLSMKSITLTFNGLLSLIYIPIIIGLWKFKGFKRSEKILGLFLLLTSMIMVIVPFKDWVFLVMSFGSLLASAMQPYEIWKNKNSGVVEIRLLTVFLISTLFWIIYGYAINDWVLKIVCPMYFTIVSITMFFWFIYKQPKTSE